MQPGKTQLFCRGGQVAAAVICLLVLVPAARAQDIYEEEGPPRATVSQPAGDSESGQQHAAEPAAPPASPTASAEMDYPPAAADNAPPRAPFMVTPLGYQEAVREAKSRRLSGILIFSIGTGLGLATAATAMTFYIGCTAFDDNSCGDEARIAGLVGLGAIAVSVAVGVPLWVSGQRELNTLRRQRGLLGKLGQLQLSPLPGGAALGGRWRF